MKILRKLQDKGDELGLTYLGLEEGGKHCRALFQNAEGAVHGVALHRSKVEPNKVTEKKMMKRLRDLASNNYELVKKVRT